MEDIEDICQTLAERAIAILQRNNNQRTLIVIAGPPCSGKSTLIDRVEELVNDMSGREVAVRVPTDGFQLSKAELDAFPDPSSALDRRGAPWTFNAMGLVEMIKQIKQNTTKTFVIPVYDHELRDPTRQDAVVVKPEHRIIMAEGLYLLLESEPWAQISAVSHEHWFFMIDAQKSRKRTAKRYYENGFMPTMQLALQKVDLNEAKNGKLIVTCSRPADVVVDIGTREMQIMKP